MLSTREIHQGLKIPFSKENNANRDAIYLSELSQQFAHLVTMTTFESEQKRFEIERDKLAIITAFENYLLKYHRSKRPDVTNRALEPSKMHKIGYKLLSGCIVMMSGANGFLGGTGLLSLIPGIVNPLYFVLGGLLGAVNALLFYSFESTFLKRNLGLQALDDSAQYCDLHEKQIKSTRRINRLLFDYTITHRISSNEFKACSKLAVRLNQNIDHKKQIFKEYEESVGSKLFRKAVTGFGAVMAAGNGYFLMHSLLAMVAASLLATPVGWGLISVAIVSSVSLFAFIRSRGLFNLLNPTYEQYQRIQKNVNQFDYRSQEDFDAVLLNKIEYKKAPESLPELDRVEIIRAPINVTDRGEYLLANRK